jgi:hypothetical protein
MPHSDSLGQPIKNRLLAALPTEQYERLRPLMKLVSLASSEILYQSSTSTSPIIP